MITVTVERKSGAATIRTKVTAKSIRRALQLAGGPAAGAEARVVFPIDPEGFFTPHGASRHTTRASATPAAAA